ncbi:GNAT family N-acetyltransferase [Pseudorhodoferax sp. LjRoot39]|uniref:GNAT family N-acetyltransferase n=1 Tax=Pseudorhodoferax sp. LjRoot39 TaxID=3342328 RepID=UPI003ECF4804
MDTTIRRAQQADLPAIAALFDLYRQFYDQAPDPVGAQAFIQQRFANGESVLLVAQAAQGGLAGFCQLYPSFCSVEAMPIYVLYDLFVVPAARRSGAGRRLLQAAHAQAVADGKSRMDLTTARTNHAAQRLYASLGWTRDDVFLAYSLRTGTADVAPAGG